MQKHYEDRIKYGAIISVIILAMYGLSFVWEWLN
jgi:hypothetical protein